MTAKWLSKVFIGSMNIWLLGLLLCWGTLVILLRLIGRQYKPTRLVRFAAPAGKVTFRLPAQHHFIKMKGTAGAFLSRDLIFMWRQKRSFYFYLTTGFGLMLVVSLVQKSFNSAFIALLFVEFFFSFILINKLLALFEQDLETLEYLMDLVSEPDGVLDRRLLVPFVDEVVGSLTRLEPQHAQPVRDLGRLCALACECNRQVGFHRHSAPNPGL